jgi:hypothetical protein
MSQLSHSASVRPLKASLNHVALDDPGNADEALPRGVAVTSREGQA